MIGIGHHSSHSSPIDINYKLYNVKETSDIILSDDFSNDSSYCGLISFKGLIKNEPKESLSLPYNDRMSTIAKKYTKGPLISGCTSELSYFGCNTETGQIVIIQYLDITPTNDQIPLEILTLANTVSKSFKDFQFVLQ